MAGRHFVQETINFENMQKWRHLLITFETCVAGFLSESAVH